MKILHTADWHLNDRLGRIDRTDDLRRAVERIAAYCMEHAVDVLLVAGDLFSELARPDALRETIRHWQNLFSPFLSSGGTILTLTGNHDNENFCQTLCHAMSLAAPTAKEPGETVSRGRLYLAAEPTFLRLPDRSGTFNVQFMLMPFPTPTRYLKGETGQKYSGPDEKNKLLVKAFSETVQELRAHPQFDTRVPCVLGAHVHVHGSEFGPSLFRMNFAEDVVVTSESWAHDFCYVALGHIHKPQQLGAPHVRYSGSIEKMDLGEQHDIKGVVLLEVGPAGLVGEMQTLPMPSTPIYEVQVFDPPNDLTRLKIEYADAGNDLVKLQILYTAGRDNLEELLRELEVIFPRWYAREWKETGQLGETLTIDEADRSKGFGDTVRDYLNKELVLHEDAERAELLRMVNELMEE